MCTNQVAVYLFGDTIYKGPLDFEKLFGHSANMKIEQWCLSSQGRGHEWDLSINRLFYKNRGQIYGAFTFYEREEFLKATRAAKKGTENRLINPGTIPEAWGVVLIPRQSGMTVDIENYYQAKIDFLRVRSFNNCATTFFGMIEKSRQ